MVIAFTSLNGLVFEHFGRTPELTYFEIKDGKIVNQFKEDMKGHGHGEIVERLKKHGVNALICGGLGQGAVDYLKESNIKIYAGQSGSVEMLAENFVLGLLTESQNASCDHTHPDGKEHCIAGGCGNGHCGE